MLPYFLMFFVHKAANIENEIHNSLSSTGPTKEKLKHSFHLQSFQQNGLFHLVCKVDYKSAGPSPNKTFQGGITIPQLFYT